MALSSISTLARVVLSLVRFDPQPNVVVRLCRHDRGCAVALAP
jgi:hypothetical protein